LPALPLLQYDTWIKSEEWTFLACVALGAGHALSFLITRWSIAMRARITCVPVSPAPLWPLVRAVDRTAGRPRLTPRSSSQASDLATAKLVQVMPKLHRGKGEIVRLFHKPVSRTC
jgi:hypothetical protein